jgi:flavin-dependent dehydrogenase
MIYDVAIIGGGLAGLSLSIDLKKRGYHVLVIEKGSYPRHKVCGEYISMESYNYLQKICPTLSAHDLPMIHHFKLTTGSNKEFNTMLDLGGFGISRYLLEEMLFKEAEKQGVEFMLNRKALDIKFDTSKKKYIIKTNSSNINASLVCNATGRKSNFKTSAIKPIGTNYVGVKYHIKIPRSSNLIEIHNFPGGYCGISNIEDDKSCICYIVNAQYLNKVKNSIPELEKTFLFKNSNLEKIFCNAEFVFKDPITVSGINFSIKEPVKDDLFYLGDSAGSMAPITGNGMSMGLRSAFTLANNIDHYFSTKITKEQLVATYTQFWSNEFSTRIKLSRYLQRLSEYPFLTNRTIELFNLFPALAKGLIKQTHGKPF